MMHFTHKQRGFTLLETAIVLMIVSLITSAIWVAGDRVWNNYRVYRTEQQMIQVVNKMRDYYGLAYSSWPGVWVAGTDITTGTPGGLPSLDTLGLLPAEMRRNSALAPGDATEVIDHAINNSHGGGSFHVLTETNPTGAGRKNAFRIELQGLTTTPCTNLLMAAPLTSDTIGFVRVGTVNGAGPVGGPMIIYKGVSQTPGLTLPLTASVASTWCNGATEVDFDYTLQN